MKRSQSARPPSKKRNDVNYEVRTSTGDKTYDGSVNIKIRGEFGVITIPLSKTKRGEKPFQSNANDEFTCRTSDVGRIKRVSLEYNGAKDDNSWHLKKFQIIKESEVYNFPVNVRLDYRDNTFALYPMEQQKEDYVQSELRRLKSSLRSESLKMRRPAHKPHEPYVYNDLKPYFDTDGVEKAIYEPLESTSGYYTRLTALRIVEPWEGFGMDYGVSYEFLKRRTRSKSAKRATTKADEPIDRTQGSTHCPEYPCVNLHKPIEYHRTLTLNDVSNIRSFIRSDNISRAESQKGKDYKRTRDDFYRMQLDNAVGTNPSSRDRMVRAYHSYLGTTPGSKKAVRDLCDQIPLNVTKPTVQAAN